MYLKKTPSNHSHSSEMMSLSAGKERGEKIINCDDWRQKIN